MEWLLTKLGDIWQPFLLGCFVLGLAAGVAGYIAVQIIWRIHVIQSWKERQKRRKNSIQAPKSQPGLAPSRPSPVRSQNKSSV